MGPRVVGLGRFLPLCALVLGLLPALTTAQPAEDLTCAGQFEATLLRGPSAGTALTGTLTLDIDADGALSGALEQPNEIIPVSGKIRGGSIHLQFDLGNGTRLRGIGQVEHPFTCSGSIEGSAIGPLPRDGGNWSFAVLPGCPPCR